MTDCRCEISNDLKADRKYGKEIIDCKGGTQTEVLGASLYSMQALRTTASLFAEV
jgi:hypothetical protein